MRVFALLAFLAVHTAGVFAAPSTYYWVDWFNGQATNPGYTTTGKITTPTTTVDVTFKSSANIHGIQYGANGDINYYGTSPQVGSIPGTASPYVSAEVANPPPTPDIIRLNAITTVTLTFSKPIVNPVLAIMSTNTNTYEFNSDFEILSMSGQPGVNNGYWGNGLWTRVYDPVSGKYKLVTDTRQTEPHGTIKLIGTFSTITWSTTASESWHGFTLGVKSTQGEALANTGLGPAQGTVKCTTWGDPHVISFDGQHFDCHIAGRRNYYTTVSQGLTTTVDTIHSPLAPPRQAIMVNSDVYVSATGIGEIHAQPNGQVFFTPATGPQVEVTVTPVAANNQWHEINPGFFIIRNPGGVANKFGVYIAAAQMTVYFQRGIFVGSPYWNVDIIAVKLNSDTGLCMDKSLCNTPPGPAPTCPNNTPTPAQIEAACLAAVQTSANPLYTFCVADVSLACDLDVALTYTPPDNPPAPLTPNSPINGDPQFVGLQGQSYQVHGADDTVFALLSTPRMQMNGLFTYIGVGGDCNYNDTMCWSHPGTYISQLGFRVAHHDGREDKILLVSGPHSQGLRMEVNGKAVSTNEAFFLGSSVRVHVKSASVAQVHINDLFIVEVTNSDNFFNMGVQLLRRDWLAAGAKRVKLTAKSSANALSVYPQVELHGLLGITWRNVVYPHNRVYEGDVMDYAMESHDMFDTDFQYTKYLA